MISRVLILFVGSYLIVPAFLIHPLLSHLLFLVGFFVTSNRELTSWVHCFALIAHSYLHHLYSTKPTTIAFELTLDEYFHLFYIPFLVFSLKELTGFQKWTITLVNTLFNLLVILTKTVTSFYITFAIGSLFIWLPLWIKDGMSFNLLPMNMFLVHLIFFNFDCNNSSTTKAICFNCNMQFLL